MARKMIQAGCLDPLPRSQQRLFFDCEEDCEEDATIVQLAAITLLHGFHRNIFFISYMIQLRLQSNRSHLIKAGQSLSYLAEGQRLTQKVTMYIFI